MFPRLDLNPSLSLNKPVTLNKFWFEQYHWYIDENSNIIVGGKNAKQNEHLWRNMKNGDLFVHADIHGAPCVVCPARDASKMEEVCQFAVCISKAWKSGSERAWYVSKDQVSKSAPSGEYLSQGGFTIRGKKTFCTAPQLLMGLVLIAYDGERWRFDIEKCDEHEVKQMRLCVCPWSCAMKASSRVKITPSTGKKKKSARIAYIKKNLKYPDWCKMWVSTLLDRSEL